MSGNEIAEPVLAALAFTRRKARPIVGCVMSSPSETSPLSDVEPDYSLNPHWWLGSLACAITHHLRGNMSDADLRRSLNEFLRSPVASEEMKALLREIRSFGKNRGR